MSSLASIPEAWKKVIVDIKLLVDFEERLRHIDHSPPIEYIWRPLRLCHPEDVKVLILGQNPYPRSIADGIAFSVRSGKSHTPTTRAIFKEWNLSITDSPCLDRWVRQGVLLLNSELTMGEGIYSKQSHYAFWHRYIRQIIQYLSQRKRIVFVLWGKKAAAFEPYIDQSHNLVLKSSFPSLDNGDFQSSNQREQIDLYTYHTIQW